MRPLVPTLTLLSLLYGCSPGTGGELVDIQLELQSVPAADDVPCEFETRTGFSVALEEAVLSVATVLAYAPKDDELLSLSGWLVGRALAHGGYDPFNGRIVRMEYAEPLELDLCAKKVQRLGDVLAETGPLYSATIRYADRVRGEPGQGYVRGSAERDGERIEFEGTLQLEDEELLRRVDGIRARGDVAGDGTLRLEVHPEILFEEAHFERLDTRDDDAPRAITSRTQVHTAWVLGARSSRAFSTHWRNPE